MTSVNQNGKSVDHLPLSVMLFHNAMERNISMSKFAQELGLSPLSLRQFVEGNTQRPRNKTLELLDGALRNYISGQTLPDSDQARRLADILSVPTIEVARIIIAHHTAQVGGVTVAPGTHEATSSAAEAEAHALSEGEGAISMATTSSQASSEAPAVVFNNSSNREETQLLNLWRQLHPQGRRATLIYIAGLLAEG
jgi:hypothetical protein